MQDNPKTNPGAKARKSIARAPATTSTDTRGATRRQKTGMPVESGQDKPQTKKSRPASKQARVIELLRRKEGASVAAVMKITDWQKHSVHGFFAGVIRKKLQLNLVRTGEGDKAAYRIASSTSAVPKAGKTAKPAKPRKSATRKSSRNRAR